jgi:hypothetical protein
VGYLLLLVFLVLFVIGFDRAAGWVALLIFLAALLLAGCDDATIPREIVSHSWEDTKRDAAKHPVFSTRTREAADAESGVVRDGITGIFGGRGER